MALNLKKKNKHCGFHLILFNCIGYKTRDPENLHAQNTTPRPNNKILPTPPRVWSIMLTSPVINQTSLRLSQRQTLPSTVMNVARERKEESRFLNGVIQGSTALITSAAAALGQQGNGTRLQIPSFSQRWNQLSFAANISLVCLCQLSVMSAALILFIFIIQRFFSFSKSNACYVITSVFPSWWTSLA